ncbi:MAG: SIMPL domain-containing protein, partial [Planctomycetes bacterium]|nr:SIMPL domain-containing protein [Planctomycetota bacterium]
VTGTGSAIVDRQPEAIEMRTELHAYGGTVEMALEKLTERFRKAELNLRMLEADKASIAMGDPSVAPLGPSMPPVTPYATPATSSYSAPGLVSPTPRSRPAYRPTKVYRASAGLTARWTAAMDTPQAALIAVEGLRERVTQKTVAGPDDLAHLSPQEQEVVEESLPTVVSAGSIPGFSSWAGSPTTAYATVEGVPGQIQLLFVGRLPEAERKKALAQAVARARQQAAELAEAAGMTLGPIVELNMPTVFGAYTAPVASYYPAMTQPYWPGGAADGDSDPNEMVVPDPRAIVFQFQVSARFALDPAAE